MHALSSVFAASAVSLCALVTVSHIDMATMTGSALPDTSYSSCQDSDNGNTYKRGKTATKTVTGMKATYTDECTDALHLQEHLCVGVVYHRNTVSCVNGCKNGACLTKSLVKCQDSDNGNTFKRGKTAVTNIEGKKTTYTDECTGGKNLQEHICSGVNYAARAVQCAHGCKNGACLEKTLAKCQDSDKSNTFKRGKTAVTDAEGKKTTYTDECTGDTQVREHTCPSTTTYVATINSCEFGCVNGACLKKPLR